MNVEQCLQLFHSFGKIFRICQNIYICVCLLSIAKYRVSESTATWPRVCFLTCRVLEYHGTCCG